MYTRKMALAVLLVAGGAVAVGASFHFQSSKTTFLQGQKKDLEEPTVIQEGRVTEKQKQHRKLFKHSGPKLQDLEANQNGDVEVEVGLGLMMVMSETAPKPPVFQSALCNADAVIVGTISNKSSQLTEAENFVFTDYEITVEEVIKNNATAPIEVASMITTTRDGGAVKLNNRIFRAKREDFDAPFVGRRYLMFLRFIAATGSYLMYGNGTFQLESQKVLALGTASREILSNAGSKDEPTFLSEIRTFAAAGCQPKQ